LATGFIFKLWHCLGFSVQEEKYHVWLQGDWQTVNELNAAGHEQPKIYEFAKNFASHQSGKIVVGLAVDKIFGTV